ncbi:SGNH/GDSL hydrolase family protein [Bradyrhizobium sp. 2S1]|uniref:SGNH/GDSL hydrolase family protein n=1 Tax=Bradyrhizobium sp. 2S1 TaxID=1404429 RepID=UPI001408E4CA|nr:GDSL-type esterase/lipase family protein [Bradyrhizobium sp. 2S1]MCK7668727.1 GDSL-type esterase/lipase family protein [Bradyrhizobium sp. 2S1]
MATISSVSAAPLSGPACDEADQQIASTPTIPDSANALRRDLKNVSSLPAQASIVMLGDSLVEAWPEDLASSLAAGHPVLNLGVGRDRIQNTLWLLTSFEQQLKRIQPQSVILLLGTNNIYLDKPCGVRLAFDHLFDRISRIWPKAHLVQILILPRGPNMTGAKENISAVNASLSSREKSVQKYRVLDASAIACQNSTPCANYREDLLHLTRTGYEQLTQIVRTNLSSN